MTTYWFRPKRYGYGATPVTWQGWVLVRRRSVAVDWCSGRRWLLPHGASKISWAMA